MQIRSVSTAVVQANFAWTIVRIETEDRTVGWADHPGLATGHHRGAGNRAGRPSPGGPNSPHPNDPPRNPTLVGADRHRLQLPAHGSNKESQ